MDASAPEKGTNVIEQLRLAVANLVVEIKDFTVEDGSLVEEIPKSSRAFVIEELVGLREERDKPALNLVKRVSNAVSGWKSDLCNLKQVWAMREPFVTVPGSLELSSDLPTELIHLTNAVGVGLGIAIEHSERLYTLRADFRVMEIHESLCLADSQSITEDAIGSHSVAVFYRKGTGEVVLEIGLPGGNVVERTENVLPGPRAKVIHLRLVLEFEQVLIALGLLFAHVRNFQDMALYQLKSDRE